MKAQAEIGREGPQLGERRGNSWPFNAARTPISRASIQTIVAKPNAAPG